MTLGRKFSLPVCSAATPATYFSACCRTIIFFLHHRAGPPSPPPGWPLRQVMWPLPPFPAPIPTTLPLSSCHQGNVTISANVPWHLWPPPPPPPITPFFFRTSSSSPLPPPSLPAPPNYRSIFWDLAPVPCLMSVCYKRVAVPPSEGPRTDERLGLWSYFLYFLPPNPSFLRSPSHDLTFTVRLSSSSGPLTQHLFRKLQGGWKEI